MTAIITVGYMALAAYWLVCRALPHVLRGEHEAEGSKVVPPPRRPTVDDVETMVKEQYVNGNVTIEELEDAIDHIERER